MNITMPERTAMTRKPSHAGGVFRISAGGGPKARAGVARTDRVVAAKSHARIRHVEHREFQRMIAA